MKVPAVKFRTLAATAAAFAMLSAATAKADDVADMALEAETLLRSNEPATAFDAMDAAVDAFWRAAPLIIKDARFDPKRDSASFAPSEQVAIHLRPLGYGFEIGGDSNRIVLDADIEILSGPREAEQHDGRDQHDPDVEPDDLFWHIERQDQ